MRLGIPLARQTLLAACFGTLFASAALAEIWRHSNAVATLAQGLAATSATIPKSPILPDSCMTSAG